MKGKKIFFTAKELHWIYMTMANQDAFDNEEDEKINNSIKDKTKITSNDIE